MATAFAQQHEAKGIVTGESLGQEASQTLDNRVVLTDAAKEVPIHHPLIGYDKEETMKIAREIGTYSASVSKAPLGTIRTIEAELESTKNLLPV